MKINKKLPTGIENFNDIQKENFYYIDKTGFIKELLYNWGKVNLITRPRRFGKTLNMYMLKSFFEIGTDKSIFDSLLISKETKLCEQYMGQFPVIFLSLKSVAGDNYDMAYNMFCEVINEEARHFQWLMDSKKLTQYDKIPLKKILDNNFTKQSTLFSSLRIFSELLHKHYDKKVIILIDEYDVPLEKAYQNNYYDKMITLIRSVFEMVLKTNDHLYFAVITGCLRISKESIFTGLNNFSVHSVSDSIYDGHFGFTDEEVKQLLSDYNMTEKYSEVKEWYDGYRFGQKNLYCPWDVINYVKDHTINIDAEVRTYWANSSSNAIVKDIIKYPSKTLKNQIEILISKGTLDVKIAHELTYNDLSVSDSNKKIIYLWSILYTTGYLTDVSESKEGWHKLAIPNKEVQQIFEEQISNWFLETSRNDSKKFTAFCNAIKNGNEKEMQHYFKEYLQSSISIRDTYVRKNKKENFYHGILLGLLSTQDNWIVKSNVESGIGYSDILIEIPSDKIGCIIEIKYAEKGKFDTACNEAMAQINKKNYAEKLMRDGMQTIHAYGVACYIKDCKIIYKKIVY